MAEKIETAKGGGKHSAVGLMDEIAAKVQLDLETEPERTKPGLIERFANQIRNAGWKVVEWVDGKESAALAKRAQDAYLDGRLKEGFGLAMEANKKATGHALAAIEQAAAKAKRFVTGGEAVIQPGAPVTPAQGEQLQKEQNAR